MDNEFVKPGDKDPRMKKIIDHKFDKIYNNEKFKKKYNPEDVVITIGGVPVEGYVDGDFMVHIKRKKHENKNRE